MFLPSSVFAVVLAPHPLTPQPSEHVLLPLDTDTPILSAAAHTFLASLRPLLPRTPHAYLAVKKPLGLRCDKLVTDGFVGWLSRAGAPPPLHRDALASLSLSTGAAVYCARRGQISRGGVSVLLFAPPDAPHPQEPREAARHRRPQQQNDG